MQPEVLDAIADTIVETVKAHTAPLAERLDALAREPIVGPAGPAGEKGADGKDAPAVDIVEVAKQAAALVPAGRDGADADVDVVVSKVLASLNEQVAALVSALVSQEVTKAIAAIERPKDGANGRDGIDGKDGQSVTLEQLTPVVAAEVTKAVDALPRPKDGADGRDGVGVAGALLDQSGTLVLTLSNGTMQPLGVVVGAKGDRGQDGTNGRDGADGFGFDDLSVEGDGERTVSFTFRKGERVKSFPVSFPVQINRGLFDVTKTYYRGDCVPWAGSTWCAVRTTSGFKPGDGPTEKTGWALIAMRGREGKKGIDGVDGKPGRDGKDGVVPKW